jgi:hypothetical protein
MDADTAITSLQQCSRVPKAQARANIAFGGVKSIENPRSLTRVDAAACVRHADANAFPAGVGPVPTRAHADQNAPLILADGIDGIDQQV